MLWLLQPPPASFPRAPPSHFSCPLVTCCGPPPRPALQVLRETGCLNGVLTTDASKSVEELVAMTKNWTIVGQDLLKVVRGTGHWGTALHKWQHCRHNGPSSRMI
jgi:hypothetical protein